jgi:hypothetical protein
VLAVGVCQFVEVVVSDGLHGQGNMLPTNLLHGRSGGPMHVHVVFLECTECNPNSCACSAAYRLPLDVIENKYEAFSHAAGQWAVCKNIDAPINQ